MKICSIDDVVVNQLCTGCGACAYIEPLRYRMGDVFDLGRRPFLIDNAVPETFEALKICPGISLSHSGSIYENDELNQELLDGWGPIYEVWEGYASDKEIRFSGSSGGAATALALFCLEKQEMSGVLHTGAREGAPYMNQTVISRSRKELLERNGSRYSPASPAEALKSIEESSEQLVFIGKPCDVTAVKNARKIRSELDKKLGLVIAFFCAGTPSTKGLLDLLSNNGVSNPASIDNLRYRGNGWPGMWKVNFKNKDGENIEREQTYADSWGFLQKYRQWRCYICPDHTGEFADISVGDPWYREVKSEEVGKSLIIARTKKGLDIIKAAENAGFIVLEKNNPNLLPLSQPNLLATRGALWARLKVLSLFGVAVPKYKGFKLFKFWVLNLSFKEKLGSVIGTAKRIFSKGLRRPINVCEYKK